MESETIDPGDVRFFSGSANPQLAKDIAGYLGVPLEETAISRFSNDNLRIQLGASVRSRKVFIVQSLSPPVNDHLVELLMMLDIARAASAREVQAIIPYFSFARSDKKDAPRISITARLVADLLKASGATQVMTMMLHSPQVHGFFSVPADPLSSRPVLQHYFQQRDLSQTIVVAPDRGIADSAHRFAAGIGLKSIAAHKDRISDTEVRVGGIIPQQLEGSKRAIVYDDEIATGGTIREVSQLLVAEGIKDICVVCTHGVFVRNAVEKLVAIPQISEIVTTDTVCIPSEKRHEKMTILPVARIFGEAIRRNYLRESIGSLFVFGDDGEE